MTSNPARSRHDRTGTHLRGPGHGPHSRKEIAPLTLGALGVVYGDIGTSPLYAIKECTSGPHGTVPSKDELVQLSSAALETNVLGVLSLVFWALTLVICVKYLVFVLRADNRGEGGILSLGALVNRSSKTPMDPKRLAIPLLLALFGAGLLFGEGVITPAIS